MPIMTEKELEEARKRIDAGVKLGAGIFGAGLIVTLGILMMACPPDRRPLFLVLVLSSMAILTVPFMVSFKKRTCSGGGS